MKISSYMPQWFENSNYYLFQKIVFQPLSSILIRANENKKTFDINIGHLTIISPFLFTSSFGSFRQDLHLLIKSSFATKKSVNFISMYLPQLSKHFTFIKLTSVLHMGQVYFLLNHSQRQSSWNSWQHMRVILVLVSRQMEQFRSSIVSESEEWLLSILTVFPIHFSFLHEVVKLPRSCSGRPAIIFESYWSIMYLLQVLQMRPKMIRAVTIDMNTMTIIKGFILLLVCSIRLTHYYKIGTEKAEGAILGQQYAEQVAHEL